VSSRPWAAISHCRPGYGGGGTALVYIYVGATHGLLAAQEQGWVYGRWQAALVYWVYGSGGTADAVGVKHQLLKATENRLDPVRVTQENRR